MAFTVHHQSANNRGIRWKKNLSHDWVKHLTWKDIQWKNRHTQCKWILWSKGSSRKKNEIHSENKTLRKQIHQIAAAASHSVDIFIDFRDRNFKWKRKTKCKFVAQNYRCAVLSSPYGVSFNWWVKRAVLFFHFLVTYTHPNPCDSNTHWFGLSENAKYTSNSIAIGFVNKIQIFSLLHFCSAQTLMGLFYYVHSVALIEDLPLEHKYADPKVFFAEADKKYEQVRKLSAMI